MKSSPQFFNALLPVWAAMAILGSIPAAQAAPITWGAPATCAADTDVVNAGQAQYAYDWSQSQTLNGVSFTATASSTTASTNATLTFAKSNSTAYTNTAAGSAFNTLSPAYKNILTGGAYTTATGASVTITLKNLTIGRNYTVQYWVDDPRGTTRLETLASAGGNTGTLTFNTTGSSAGGLGSYCVGTFFADATTESFTVTTVGSGGQAQINALAVRVNALGFWDGAVNGNWDATTTNFTGGLGFTAVSDLVSNAWFADTDGLGNPVANTAITIQPGGVAIGAVNFLNNADAYTFQNTGGDLNGITGASAVNKNGTGLVTFAGPETYTGKTTIAGGTLALGAGGSIAGTPVITVAAGGVFDVSAVGGFSLGSTQVLAGTGEINGNVSAAAGAQILPGGAGAIGTLTFGNNLTLNGQNMTFDLSAHSNDLIQVMGTLTNNGVVMIGFNPLPGPGTYVLISYAARTGAGSFALSNTVPSNVTLNVGSTAVTVTVAASAANLVWHGDGTANHWDVQTTTNWLNGENSALYEQEDSVTFDDTGSALPAIDLATTLLPGNVTVNASQNYIFAGSGKISGSAGLTQGGSGRLIIDNAGSNDFSGGVLINAGSLQLGNNDANGNLPATGGIINNATLIFDRSDVTTLAGAISGSGSVFQAGSGTTILPAVNTYSGGTTVSNGTLQLNVGGAAGTGPIMISNNATLALSDNGGIAYNAPISGSGNINIIGLGDAYYVQFGASLDGFTGTLNIGYSGSGEFVDRVNNDFLNSGVTVNVTNGGKLFLKSVGMNACRITLSGTGLGDGLGALDDNGGPGSIMGPVTLTGNTVIGANSGEIAGVIDDGGKGYGFTKVDVGTLTLSAANTYSGATTISNGTLALNTFGSIANSFVINLAGGILDVSAVSGGFSLQAGQTLSGSGTVNGAVTAPASSQIIPGGLGSSGTLVFSNGLTLNGQTLAFDLGATPTSSSNDLVTVSGAPLVLNSGSTISLNYLTGSLAPGVYTLFTYPALAGSGTFTLASAYPNVTLNVGATATAIIIGNGAPGLTWQGDGVANRWDFTTANWLNGDASTLFAQNDNVVFTDTGSITPAINLTTDVLPSTVVINATRNYSFSGAGSITGPASLVMLNSGTLTINNSNSYSGGTIVIGGALQLGANGTSGSITGPVIDNAQVILNHADTNILNNLITGSGALTVNGSGVEILASSNSYSGGTTVNGGIAQLNNPNAAGIGPVVDNSAINLLSAGFRYANTFSGSGVINILPAENTFSSTNTASDFAQFDGIVNGDLTINVPVGAGVARVETDVTNGTANNLTFNITNNGQLYLKAPTLTATVNIAGTGYGDGLGAIRWSGTNILLSGLINLTGNATLAGPGVFAGSIGDNGNGYEVAICSGELIFYTVTSTNFGNTTITNGATLALVNGSAIENSEAINIASGSILDVSGEGLTYPVPTGIPGAGATQTLAGTGKNGIINGSVTLGTGGSLAVSITGDGTPSLIITNGTLTLNDNPVKVNGSAGPLGGGIYPLVAVATNDSLGTVAGDVSTSLLSFGGAGLADGATASLSLSNAMLYLVVNQSAPAPAAFSNASVLPNGNGLQLVFNGSAGHNYSVLTTTNLTLPLTQWQIIATGTFASGPVTNIDSTATNSSPRFYDIRSQ